MTRLAKAWLAAGMGMWAALGATASGGAADLVRVGEGPFITGGAFFIAREKGYFKKLNLEIETKRFEDGAFAVPSMIAGELELTLMTANASLFNSVAKGAPLVVILDRGHNRPGFGYTVVNVTQALYDQGVRTAADFGKDVQWIVNVPQPDLMRMLGQNQVDATDLAYQFGFFAQNNKWGPIVVNDDEVVPGAEIATYAVRKDFLQKNRDAVVRFAMAYLQGIKEFNAAARDPGAHPDIVDILAQNTALNKPELVRAIAPHWSYIADDGVPLVDSIMEMQDFWSGKYFNFVEKKVPREQLFDLNVAKEAQARLEKEKPFGN